MLLHWLARMGKRLIPQPSIHAINPSTLCSFVNLSVCLSIYQSLYSFCKYLFSYQMCQVIAKLGRTPPPPPHHFLHLTELRGGCHLLILTFVVYLPCVVVFVPFWGFGMSTLCPVMSTCGAVPSMETDSVQRIHGQFRVTWRRVKESKTVQLGFW